jgi:hypothetical protein
MPSGNCLILDSALFYDIVLPDMCHNKRRLFRIIFIQYILLMKYKY